MSERARIGLTVTLGIVLGLVIYFGNNEVRPSGAEAFFSSSPVALVALAFLVLVPFVVGRWWVVAALIGPILAAAIQQGAGQMIETGDGMEKPLGPEVIAGLFFFALLIVFLVGLRKLFDLLRKLRAEAREGRALTPEGRGL